MGMGLPVSGHWCSRAPARLRSTGNRRHTPKCARIAAQTRIRLAGQVPPSATRLVSLHDPDARPIRKGRIDRPVEFGYKAQVTDNDDGVIPDHVLEQGNPAGAPQLAPAIERVIRRTGRRPRTLTADRGYGEKTEVQSGQPIILNPGERVTIIPGVYHAFWPESDEAVIGEVSTANDDAHDNFFVDKNIGRFPEIDEDESPLLKLLWE